MRERDRRERATLEEGLQDYRKQKITFEGQTYTRSKAWERLAELRR